MDAAKFVKLYVNGVRAFKELTNAGTRVFEVLYLEVQKNISQDRVYLSFTTLDDSVKLSQATFTRGIRELLIKVLLLQPMPLHGIGSIQTICGTGTDLHLFESIEKEFCPDVRPKTTEFGAYRPRESNERPEN